MTSIPKESDPQLVPDFVGLENVDDDEDAEKRSNSSSVLKKMASPVTGAMDAVHRLSIGKKHKDEKKEGLNSACSAEVELEEHSKIEIDSSGSVRPKADADGHEALTHKFSTATMRYKPSPLSDTTLVHGLKSVLQHSSHRSMGGKDGAVPIGDIDIRDDFGDLDSNQKEWNALSHWLQKQDLVKLELPADLDIERCPATSVWGDGESRTFARMTVVKRFNSRKLPHLLEMENSDGEILQYIYKQDDDISMDVVLVNLFRECNKIWAEAKLGFELYTYKVVACPDKTGFGEIVPGDTMLNFHAKDIHNALGTDRKTWFKFVNSMIAVAVVTAIFDISDRHHNNVLLTPDNTICLIDLSASLGKKAPMDKSLDINPVYLPKRFLDLREYSNVLSEKVWHEPPSDFYAIEHAAMMAYYPLFRDPILKKAMEAVSYKMLKPHKFLALLHERKSTRQSKEGLRNDIVKAMDNSESFHKFVAGITSIVPMN